LDKEKINKIVLYIIIALICVVLIATILVQFKTVEETDVTAIETMRESELRTALSEWTTKYNEASEQLDETNNKISEYEQKANDEQETKNLVDSELQQTNMILGKTNVKGPGVIVTLEDGDREVVASYLVDLVNELKYAGAEAISINGSRIINSSEIVEINNSYIIVNGAKRIASPYEVKAIGDQTYLTSILSLKDSGFVDRYTSDGIIVKVEQRREIQIPKYDGDMKFNYAYEKEDEE
jgi:uncharacterized protein YlxW (UPF0749 family)